MKISFPAMGIYTDVIKNMFENLGCEVILPPKTTIKTIQKGSEVSPKMQCVPFKWNIGNYIEVLERNKELTLVHYNSCGRCRFHTYYLTQTKILRNLGYEFDGIYSIRSKHLLRDLKRVTNASYLKIIKTINKTYKEIKEVEKENFVSEGDIRIGIFGEIFCYSDDTEILTEDGWIFFKDLKEEEVIQINPKNLEMNLIKPKKYCFDYNGKMIYLHSKKMDLLVTPNHRILLEDREHKKKSLRADELPSRFFIFKSGRWKKGREINIKKYWKSNGKQRNHFGLISMNQEQYCKFMGIWLAEGSICKWYSKKEKRYRKWIYITQKDKKVRKKIEELLKEIGINIDYNHYSKANAGSYRFINEDLFSYLEQFGKAKDKFIPREILDTKKKYLKLFLKWFGYGDGETRFKINKTIKYKNQRKTTKSIFFYSSSQKLIGGIQEILFKLNKQGNILKYDCKNYSPKYSIQLSQKNYTLIRRKQNIKKVDYKGKVYCVSVDYGFIVVRRNGKACVCGNTILSPECNLNLFRKIKERNCYIHTNLLLSNFIKETLFRKKIFDKKIRAEAKELFPEELGGHGFFSIESMLYYIKNNYDGVVFVRPLSCMPEVTVEPFIKSLSKENKVPLLILNFDETTAEINVDNRLDAFVETIRMRK